MTPLEAALNYAAKLGWAVFPRPNGRYLRGSHGFLDATRDPEQITRWWTEYPNALIAARTGRISDLIVMDLDRKNGKDGFDTLEEKGKSALPDTPMAHSPHLGLHVYFRCHWRVKIYTGTDVLGPGVDVLGENGNVALPTPGQSDRWTYRWDALLRPSTTPFAMAPVWLQPYRPKPAEGNYFSGNLNPRLVLERACEMIRNAGPGERNEVLNRQAFLVGCLVKAGALQKFEAEHELEAAASCMVAATKGAGKKAEYDLNRAFKHGLLRGHMR